MARKTRDPMGIGLPDRQTTMPPLPPEEPSEADPRRTPEGPSAERIQQLNDSLRQMNEAELGILSSVSERQLEDDRAEYFEESHRYINRTGDMMLSLEEAFQGFPFTGRHLRHRTKRLDELDQLELLLEKFLGRVRQTRTVERADAIRMADLAIQHVKARASSLTTPRAEAAHLNRAAEVPLSVWNKRLDKLRRARALNDRYREALARAGARADAAEIGAEDDE
jgi:hypothetical protein